jgi:hypothetical protein
MHLITFGGWEERFLCGVQDLLTKYDINRVSILYTNHFADWTAENRSKVEEGCRKKKIRYDPHTVDFSSSKIAYEIVLSFCESNLDKNESILLDITTMPREIIWYFLFYIWHTNISTHCSYYKPVSYDSWLTEDATTPRLALKMSGIADLSKKTMLIIVTGFDVSRAEQLYYYFEPDKTVLLLQEGTQFDNNIKNRDNHSKFASKKEVSLKDINCYADDFGKDSIKGVINDYISTHNIVLASLGPKLSAISMFQLQREYQDIALCYAPSKAINKNYSSGCGESFFINL